MCRCAAGFTLMELVATLVVLGIVSVFITPNFLDTSTFSEHATRDQIISAARIAQQRAMFDHRDSSCYRLHIGAGSFGPQRSTNSGVTFAYFGSNGEQIIDSNVTVDTADVYFDGLGSALDDCSGSATDNEIDIVDAVSLSLCVYSTGYIRDQAC